MNNMAGMSNDTMMLTSCKSAYLSSDITLKIVIDNITIKLIKCSVCQLCRRWIPTKSTYKI